MCGIAGMLGACDEALLRRMCDSMKHRGPDDDGFFYDQAAGACIGMCRLSIIDLSGGKQPMSDENKRYRIVFNGEIYNYQALREELIKKGHTLLTQSDTETIVHLYEDYKEECLKYIEGDFAFAVWDSYERSLFIARDRLGVKPLYYWQSQGKFAFASELKALLCVPEISRAIDPEALDSYLTFLYVPSPNSIFQEIKKLLPGCWMKVSDARLQIERYWHVPSVLPVERPIGELQTQLIEQLEEAVRMRLVSDVPLGAFLSGGIDSSSIVALMSRNSRQPVKTFSIGFESPHQTYNELPFARIAAKCFQTDHREFTVQPDISDLLPKAVWHLDEPFADSSALLTFLISREARNYVTVALTGIGGDEMFAGYPRYLGARVSLFYEHLPYFIRSAMAYLIGSFPEPMTSTNTIGRLKRFTQGSLKSQESRYLLWLSYVNYELKQRLYSKGLKDELGSFWPHISYEEILRQLPGDYPDKVNALDVQTYLPDDLLCMADKMSMASGLELRVPFCDRKVVEFALSISVGRRTSGLRLKSLLKDSLKEILPGSLLKKRKQGFMMPIGAWLRNELQGLCRDVLSPERVKKRGFFDPGAVLRLIDSHCSGRENAAHQIYAILVLELWCQRYLD